MGAGWDRAYSTLEAVPQRPVDQTYRQENPLPIDSGKQIASDDGKQLLSNSGNQAASDGGKQIPTDSGKQVAPDDDGKQYMMDSGGSEAAAKDDLYAQDFGRHHVQAHRPSRRK